MKADLELRLLAVEAKCAVNHIFLLPRPTQDVHLILGDAWKVALLTHSEKSLSMSTRFLSPP